jgi:oxygen-independent coproporphyrinogen-3 oxidase
LTTPLLSQLTDWQITNHSIYIHIPFCQVRCAYCDFNAYAQLDDLFDAYTQALCQEIQTVGQAAAAPVPIHTIFFGGGTPSLLPATAYQAIFGVLRRYFDLSQTCEITLEANPGTVDLPILMALRAAGINRLSFGVQSAQPAELRLLDRLHDFEQVQQSVTWARQAGFDNLNLDLMFGLPYQTLSDWQNTLEQVLALNPEHLSIYALTLEYDTPMYHAVARGTLPTPDADLAADMYELACQLLDEQGYSQYEISNWAKSDSLRCQHNLQYWYNQPYFGFGAGAHGFVNGTRYHVIRSPRGYIQRLPSTATSHYPFSPALQAQQPVSLDAALNDTMLLGLRLTATGVNFADFRQRFGIDCRDYFKPQLQALQAKGLIECTTTQARLTPTARLLANHVFREFIVD